MARGPAAGRSRRRPASAALLLLLAVSGCRSLDPTAGLSPGAEIAGAGAAGGGAGTTPAATEITAGAPAASIGPVQFLPLVGAPAPVAEALSRALALEAARAGVGISPAEAPATPLRLKGYLSALVDGRETVVVYVWDVVDPAGNRVSRIQGQERSAGIAAGGDPWAGVSEAALIAIARRTIGDVARAETGG